MMGVRHASKELEKERDRLRAVYAAMTDAEFEEVANDADSLTEVARATLRAEMLRRGMEAPRDTNSEVGEALTSSSETGDCWAVSGSSRGKAWTRGQRLPAAAIPETFEVEGIGPCRNARIAARLTFF